MIRGAAIAFAIAGAACVQSGSVGSDTGHAGESESESESGSGSGSGSVEDPYAVCEDIDAIGEPFPDSCAPSPDDSPCLQCIKLVCCSELLSCPSFEACACQIDCADSGAPPDFCTSSCGATGEGCDLSGCGEVECDQVCVG